VPLGKLSLITVVVWLCLKGSAHRRTILSGPGDKFSAPVFTTRHDHGRSRQPGIIALKAHGQISATDTHLDRTIESTAIAISGCSGYHSRAAAQRFSTAAFMNTHEQFPGHCFMDEFNVHTRRKGIRGAP